MKNFFVILGGMGTLATTNFLNDLNKAYKPNSDQEYLNYMVLNHATIPDRTSFILKKSEENPYDFLKEDVESVDKLNPDFYVITCNTAHFFYDDLQKLTKKPIINMIELVENKLNELKKPSTIGLFATEGTIKSRLFTDIIERCGHKALVSSKELQENINACLYKDVKESGQINFKRYHKILDKMLEEGADYIIIGCTEASYINSEDEKRDSYPIIDSEKELVNESLKLGLKLQKNIEI
ncbi:aspartate racemase [Anaerococcus hydrogenalis DSM 7454]|uniref:Aspartate racemase n=1 Tax=Anaerococcus hydrogenalis DSM 7454 TaxID=561177 RepID=B6WBB0_9FIRM|nr:amino acid racemase [Anaerococcus hydrogenalis]EEB35379.1 aspartate racemase [Anaerococcus hydrogenalis DSM 7454]